MKILTHKSCGPSAKLLRDQIEELTNRSILVTFNADRIKGPFIRYGNAVAVKGADTAFNSAAFIKSVADKGVFSNLMKAHGVYSPIYRIDTPKDYPILIRKTLTGQGGYGIVVCKDAAAFAANWSDDYVWTPFVRTQFELRVHVLGGQVSKIFKKECIDGEEGDLPIRNLDAGYHFAVKDAEVYPKVQALVDSVHKVLKGGAFYTLDIGWDKAAKKYLVFEANSGSGLNTQTAALYADYLVREMYLSDTI